LDGNSCLKSLFPSLTQRDTEDRPENVGKAKVDQINGISTKPKGRVKQSKIIFRSNSNALIKESERKEFNPQKPHPVQQNEVEFT